MTTYLTDSYLQRQITLTDTYGYRPEDIVVLKDVPELPERSHPTRANLVRDTVSSPSAIPVEIQHSFAS